jgi:hypothetical protein
MPRASSTMWQPTTSCGPNGRAVGAVYSSSAPHGRFLLFLFPQLYAAQKAITAADAAQQSVKYCPRREADGIASHQRWHVLLLR